MSVSGVNANVNVRQCPMMSACRDAIWLDNTKDCQLPLLTDVVHDGISVQRPGREEHRRVHQTSVSDASMRMHDNVRIGVAACR
jgi:hypothetical protein